MMQLETQPVNPMYSGVCLSVSRIAGSPSDWSALCIAISFSVIAEMYKAGEQPPNADDTKLVVA